MTPGEVLTKSRYSLVDGDVRLATVELPQSEAALLELRLGVVPVLVQDELLQKTIHRLTTHSLVRFSYWFQRRIRLVPQFHN